MSIKSKKLNVMIPQLVLSLIFDSTFMDETPREAVKIDLYVESLSDLFVSGR